jgi:hypothetical protein
VKTRSWASSECSEVEGLVSSSCSIGAPPDPHTNDKRAQYAKDARRRKQRATTHVPASLLAAIGTAAHACCIAGSKAAIVSGA